MTEAKLAEILIEQTVGDTGKVLNKKIGTYYDRLLLRIHSVPSLLSYLADSTVVPGENEESVKIQLDFLRLPEEFMPQLPRVLASPTDPRFFRYIKDGQARFGVEIEVSPGDFPGKAYDYAL